MRIARATLNVSIALLTATFANAPDAVARGRVSGSTQRGQVDFFSGTVVADGLPATDVLVELRGLNEEYLDSVFTDAKGSFRFGGLTLSTNFVFVVIEHEGFRPHRERLEVPYVLGGVVPIYLERENTESLEPSAGDLVVDLREFDVEIPDEAREAYEEAARRSLEGNHDRAVDLLERALETAPDFYDARVLLGSALSRVGRFDEAESEYRRAIELNPSDALASLNLGILYYQQAERLERDQDPNAAEVLADARTLFEDAAFMDPLSANARFYLGATLYRLGTYDRAERNLLLAVDLDPGESAQARLMLVNLYARMSEFEAALEQATRFVEENPDSPQLDEVRAVRRQIQAALGR